MSGLQFISSLVGSLAWPLVLATVLIVFRAEIIAQLRRPLSHVKAGPVELDWESTGQQIKERLATAPRQHQLRLSATVALGAEAKPEAVARTALKPVDLVEERWLAVLEELREALSLSEDYAGTDLSDWKYQQLIDAARSSELLNQSTIESIEGLLHLRQLALVGTHLPEDRANEFATYADATVYAMRSQLG